MKQLFIQFLIPFFLWISFDFDPPFSQIHWWILEYFLWFWIKLFFLFSWFDSSQKVVHIHVFHNRLWSRSSNLFQVVKNSSPSRTWLEITPKGTLVKRQIFKLSLVSGLEGTLSHRNLVTSQSAGWRPIYKKAFSMSAVKATLWVLNRIKRPQRSS